jgi:Cof subfamily protein (haloacid dehalogenase superfamily)
MPKPQPIPDWRSDPEALRLFADVELIAVDLDGTLVGADGAVVDQVQSIQIGLRVGRWGRPGVRLTYATGRSLTWVQRLEQRLQSKIPSGTPLVLYNGSVVVEAVTGTVVHRREISLAALESIIEIAVPQGADVLAYSGPRDILEGPEGETVAAWSQSGEQPERDVNGIEIEWGLSRSPKFEPVAVLVTTPRETSKLAGLLGLLSAIDDISVTTGGTNFFEIRPQGSNKATGLGAATARLGVDPSRVLALGDSDNDIEMLEWAGVAVVVAGATNRAQACSDYITRFGPSQGVIEVLRTIKYARRYFQSAKTGRTSGRQEVDL